MFLGGTGPRAWPASMPSPPAWPPGRSARGRAGPRARACSGLWSSGRPDPSAGPGPEAPASTRASAAALGPPEEGAPRAGACQAHRCPGGEVSGQGVLTCSGDVEPVPCARARPRGPDRHTVALLRCQQLSRPPASLGAGAPPAPPGPLPDAEAALLPSLVLQAPPPFQGLPWGHWSLRGRGGSRAGDQRGSDPECCPRCHPWPLLPLPLGQGGGEPGRPPPRMHQREVRGPADTVPGPWGPEPGRGGRGVQRGGGPAAPGSLPASAGPWPPGVLPQARPAWVQGTLGEAAGCRGTGRPTQGSAPGCRCCRRGLPGTQHALPPPPLWARLTPLWVPLTGPGSGGAPGDGGARGPSPAGPVGAAAAAETEGGGPGGPPPAAGEGAAAGAGQPAPRQAGPARR